MVKYVTLVDLLLLLVKFATVYCCSQADTQYLNTKTSVDTAKWMLGK